ncbi:hypothetical protein [Geotalea sp. SG265]|uniref:hypothetical protein n=1 Tax=Geotalea sp. SG265 TaxID=2922867 RepID=UPI001FAE8DE2|nr:hypothetical protein [Geotalea sp. SG265]
MKSRIVALLVFILGCSTLDALALEAAGNGSQQPQVKKQVEELQKTLLADKEIVALILMLKDNPEVQALLQDPDVVSAVTNGDVEALTGNPRFLELLNNPQVQEIQKRVKR